MKLNARIPAAAVLALTLAGVTGCTKLKARDELVKGVQAFKNGKYEQAVDLFQKSIDDDPNYPTAKMYLATAYSYQVTPNDDSPKNIAVANKALAYFDQVLKDNPNDIDALRQEASIHREIKKFDQAKTDELNVIKADPNDSEANYTIGNMDWNAAYTNAVKILGSQNPPLTDDGNGNVKMSKDTCAKLTAANGTLVADAITYLGRAVEINPNYDEALGMLNLAYRRKADLECGNDAARKADLAKADDYVKRELGARKANEEAKEKKNGGGIDMTK